MMDTFTISPFVLIWIPIVLVAGIGLYWLIRFSVAAAIRDARKSLGSGTVGDGPDPN